MMKKTVIALCLFTLLFPRCDTQTKTEQAVIPPKKVMKAEPAPVNMASFKSIGEADVIRMAANYVDLVRRKPNKKFLQITMPAPLLNALLQNKNGFRLIAAANSAEEVTMIVQFFTTTIDYYDISTLFGQGTICTAMSSCEMPQPTANPDVLSDATIREMAGYYPTLTARNPGKAIQQITMAPWLLQLMLGDSERLRLICAADTRTDSATILMQFLTSGRYFYADIKEVFNEGQRGMLGRASICPPPEGCGIPLILPPRQLPGTKEPRNKGL